MKAVMGVLVGVVLVVGLGSFVVTQYSWIFAARVEGQVLEMERVTSPTAILGNVSDAQVYSFSLMLKDKDGRIYTASSEDRQWSVIRRGCQISAVLYRYPFWQLDKSNTFFNARVSRVISCPGDGSLPGEPPPPADATVQQ